MVNFNRYVKRIKKQWDVSNKTILKVPLEWKSSWDVFLSSCWLKSIDLISVLLTATGSSADRCQQAAGCYICMKGVNTSSTLRTKEAWIKTVCFKEDIFSCPFLQLVLCCDRQGDLRQSIICPNRLFVLMSWSSHRQTSPVVQKRSLSLLAELIQSTKVGASPLQPLLLLLLCGL